MGGGLPFTFGIRVGLLVEGERGRGWAQVRPVGAYRWVDY